MSHPILSKRLFATIFALVILLVLYSFLFHNIGILLVQPVDAISYSRTQSITLDDYAASGFHDSYWRFNIAIGAVSYLYGVSPGWIITAVNILCVQISAFLLLKYYDNLTLFVSNRHSFILTSRLKYSSFICVIFMSPLLPSSFAWIPYNLKDCQVVFFSSLILYTTSIVNLVVLRRKFLRFGSFLFIVLSLLLLPYAFSLRSYQILIVLFIGLFLPVFMLLNPSPPFRLSKPLLILILIISAFALVALQLRFSALVFIGDLLQKIPILISVNTLYYFFDYILTPLPFVSSITDYKLLYYSAFANLVLWFLFLRKLFFPKNISSSALVLFVLLATTILSLPYVATGIQLGPRYRFFSDFNMSIFVLWAYLQRSLASIRSSACLPSGGAS